MGRGIQKESSGYMRDITVGYNQIYDGKVAIPKNAIVIGFTREQHINGNSTDYIVFYQEKCVSEEETH